MNRNSRWSSLFFVLYVLLGVYFVTNLVLAVIYDNFKGQVKCFICSQTNFKKS
jgi:two pore calcium channel protein, plant